MESLLDARTLDFMPRLARAVISQCPHHITQRGNERREIFFTPADREVYLGLLKHHAELYPTDVLGFCLMTNHVHLVLRPHSAPSLAQLMRMVQMRYSQYRHAVEGGNGHRWQSRYYSCAVEPQRLGAVMRYVELNPVRAGLVASAGCHPWSSASVHLGAGDPWGLIDRGIGGSRGRRSSGPENSQPRSTMMGRFGMRLIREDRSGHAHLWHDWSSI